jgi:hypothetical protein
MAFDSKRGCPSLVRRAGTWYKPVSKKRHRNMTNSAQHTGAESYLAHGELLHEVLRLVGLPQLELARLADDLGEGKGGREGKR